MKKFLICTALIVSIASCTSSTTGEESVTSDSTLVIVDTTHAVVDSTKAVDSVK